MKPLFLLRLLLLTTFLSNAGSSQEAGYRPFRIEELKTPAGFEVAVHARLAGSPRMMTIGPDDRLYVALRSGNKIVSIAPDGAAKAVASNLNGPHSLQFRGSDLYVAVNDGVIRIRDGKSERLLPLPSGGGHTSRTLGFAPDGKLYVSVGSTCDFCRETDSRRAAILQFEADGSQPTVYARGLRNAVGFAWHPVTQELWSGDNGGDILGDEDPPEELNIIRQGGNYGWPDCFGNGREADWGPEARHGVCADAIAPEFELPAHSAPLGVSFYTGDQFPDAYRNDALVALHGSWVRKEPSGYKVVRVRAGTGKATAMEDLLWGFFDPKTRTRSGRPVHAIPAPDGSVFISDDDTGNIYRLSYTGPRINPGGIVPVAPGVYELYGSNLMAEPGTLRLTANGNPVTTLYESRNQINFLLPGGLAGKVAIRVENSRAWDEAVIQTP